MSDLLISKDITYLHKLHREDCMSKESLKKLDTKKLHLSEEISDTEKVLVEGNDDTP